MLSWPIVPKIEPPMMVEPVEPGAWNVDMEVNLFHAMRGLKPVGVNRHFHMIVIHGKLSSPSTKNLTSKDVWDHLSSMYDLQALNESEHIPFPNEHTDFKLPEMEYKLLSDNTEFPRMQNVGMASVSSEESKAKPEGQAKGGKSSRSDSKASHQSKGNSVDSKGSSSKGDSKNSTPDSKLMSISKSDSKSGSGSASGRSEGKGGGKAGHSNSSHASTPDPSPKRTKRTRLNQSSPASDAQPSKRRR